MSSDKNNVFVRKLKPTSTAGGTFGKGDVDCNKVVGGGLIRDSETANTGEKAS